MFKFKKSTSGSNLVHIVLILFAVVLLVGMFSRVSTGGGSSAVTSDDSFKFVVSGNYVDVYDEFGSKVPSGTVYNVKKDQELVFTFSPVGGYIYDSGMLGLDWKSCWPVLSENDDGIMTVTVNHFINNGHLTISAEEEFFADSLIDGLSPTDPVSVNWKLVGCEVLNPEEEFSLGSDSTVRYKIASVIGYSLANFKNISVVGCSDYDFYYDSELYLHVLELTDPTGPVGVYIEAAADNVEFTLWYDDELFTPVSPIPEYGTIGDCIVFCLEKKSDDVIHSFYPDEGYEWELLEDSNGIIQVKIWDFHSDFGFAIDPLPDDYSLRNLNA